MVVSLLRVMWFVDYVFFFKQKTAYEMRISDWSSDVCSSDLSTPTPFLQASSFSFTKAEFWMGNRSNWSQIAVFGRLSPEIGLYFALKPFVMASGGCLERQKSLLPPVSTKCKRKPCCPPTPTSPRFRPADIHDACRHRHR